MIIIYSTVKVTVNIITTSYIRLGFAANVFSVRNMQYALNDTKLV